MGVARRHPHAARWLAWLITRIAVVVAIARFSMPTGDVRYYYLGVTGQQAGALVEYPAVGVWPLYLLQSLNPGGLQGYIFAFVLGSVLIDASFMALLARSPRSAWFWVVFGASVAFILYLRIDIVQGVLVALAGWFLVKNPRVSGVLLGVAAMMKLWPAILAAGLVGSFRKASTWRNILAFLSTCAVLAAAVVVQGGLGRLLSPFTYQSDRGLQIESLIATPFMLAAALSPGTWTVDYAASKSFEISGPGVTAAGELATIAMVGVVVSAAGWALWHFVRRPWAVESTLAWMIFIIALLIASNKVFSPQYLLWLGPLVAVALVRDGDNVWLRRIAMALVAMGVLSSIIFPLSYSGLTDAPVTLWVAVVLAIRNALLIAVIVMAARYVAQKVTRPRRTMDPVAPIRQRAPLGRPS